MEKKLKNLKRGFTLVEIVVSIAIFSFLSISIYGLYTAITNAIISYRERTTVSMLADQYMEIARNLSYSKVGTMSGNPHGELPDFPNLVLENFNGVDYQIYYVVSYIDDPADGTILAGTDFAPNDFKQIKLYIKNVRTGITNDFLTYISPQGLEGMDSGGALAIKVFDALGQPVSGATIHIQSVNFATPIDLSRLSDSNGAWVEVGLPSGNNEYRITLSKNGYSTDTTYQATEQNPNPIKADATIADGQVTQISFSIDKLSTLVFNTFDQTCQPMSGINLGVRGLKLIGTPNVLKFDNTYSSNASGKVSLNNIEWDNYTPSIIGSTYMIYGSSPIQQINLLPDAVQNFTLILGPATTNSLLVIVKDFATGNLIEGARVELQKTSPYSNSNKLTSGSVLSQQDWTGGSGQVNFVDPTRYFSDDGGVSTNIIPSGLRLTKNGSIYVPLGVLVSSTFDTGTEATKFTSLTWQPTSQDPNTNIKFQLAVNNDGETWNFVGPDGTGNTYYNISEGAINLLNNNRYFRYKAYLETTDSSKTPVLTSVNVNYVSGCYTPGQAFFPGLVADSDYTATISMDGYQTQMISNLHIGGYQVLQVLLSQ